MRPLRLKVLFPVALVSELYSDAAMHHVPNRTPGRSRGRHKRGENGRSLLRSSSLFDTSCITVSTDLP